MNYGKLTESVYERSVVKAIKANSDNNRAFYGGAELGADCAFFPYAADEAQQAMVSGQALAYGNDATVALRAFVAAVNHMAAHSGEIPIQAYANLTLTAPEKLREAKVRRIIEQAAQAAETLAVPLLGVNVQTLPRISEPTASCVVSGRCRQSGKCHAGVGEDIVMTKWLGLEGTAVIADRKFDALCDRYPVDLVEEARDFQKYLSVLPEAAAAAKSDVSVMQAVREGGIFGALWSLAAYNGVGLAIDLKKIPIRQETVEICEFFDYNPYELLAGGSLLMAAKNGTELVEAIQGRGIPAAVIGKTTVGNDRIIRHEGESRFLEPARGDEIYKLFREQK